MNARAKRRRDHEGTLALDVNNASTLVIRVMGQRPRYRPYLRIGRLPGDELVGSIDNAVAMRGLAHAILRALGDE